jgi:hypothetical protein
MTQGVTQPDQYLFISKVFQSFIVPTLLFNTTAKYNKAKFNQRLDYSRICILSVGIVPKVKNFYSFGQISVIKLKAFCFC